MQVFKGFLLRFQGKNVNLQKKVERFNVKVMAATVLNSKNTNCLIQIDSPRSKYHSLWDSFVRGENTLCVSNEIIEEYRSFADSVDDVQAMENTDILIAKMRDDDTKKNRHVLGFYPYMCSTYKDKALRRCVA